MGPRPNIHITDPKMIREIFLKYDIFQKARSPLVKLLVTGMADYAGEQWFKVRKIATPAFHHDKLKNMLPTIHKSCNDMLRKWEISVSKDESCELDVWPHIQTLTADVISRTAFGSSFEEGRKIFAVLREQIHLLIKLHFLLIFQDGEPKFEELNQLKVVSQILYEVLRLYSPAPLLTRANVKEIKLGEIVIPPGVLLSLPIMLVHHDHEYWGDDAKKFNPDRFSEGVSKASKNQISFFSFGWGPRICIGQNFALLESKLALAMILQKFTFQLSPTYMHAPTRGVTVYPQHGANIILHKI
ncbi:hypothetical protein CUMW_243610 [Citrus unshiu]|uniref:Cytochrome P450 n=1 Tax=Citrus unshiu TaxID=55188 RepID=A0A2H5QMD5_CITUN|nr:hypothetical protein CUMW_243610 [Citrus unshiu]